MAARKKAGGATPPATPIKKSVMSRADELRARLSKAHHPDAVPDPFEHDEHIEVISSGSPALDNALGVGGYARGKIHAIEGPEHAGKTSLAYLAGGTAQRAFPEGIVTFVNMERRYSESLARVCRMNVDPSRLVIVHPDSAEEACEMVYESMGYEQGAKKGVWSERPEHEPSIMTIYDSWGGSPTRGVAMAELARIGSLWWPKLGVGAERSLTTILATNHIHIKPGVMFGNPEYGTGGEKFKYAQTTRLWVHKVGEVQYDSEKLRVGHTLKIDIKKNGLAPPFKKVMLHLNYYGGFDMLRDAFELAALKGVNFKESPTGNILTLVDPKSGEALVRESGEVRFFEELRSDPDLAQEFIRQVTEWKPPNG